ncbi:MAG: class I SAM-dependent methyltransferase [Lachnospiraceae bacterium]|nr:class I SAM-dependent methyltransferase [Lachnospiraceae bacterium]
METAVKQRIQTASEPIKDRIQTYWSERSESFAGQRRQELGCDMAVLWQAEIEKYIPMDRTLKILDVGTGSGFFAILLGRLGHHVTGIDLTPSMIEEAKRLAQEQQIEADFFVMDAENPEFADESFDVVISRNLTWTLPHAEHAYGQWNRVLKKGGILLNFDADYGNEKTADFSKLPVDHTHREIGNRLLEECDAIKAELEISRHVRPLWDVQTLLELGMEEIRIDTGISRRIYTKQDALYNPTPMFAVCAVKN